MVENQSSQPAQALFAADEADHPLRSAIQEGRVMLIKAIRTGRRSFGDRVDPVASTVTVAGVKLRLQEADTWSSGEHSGDGEYIRCTWLETMVPVDPWPNIKPPKGNIHD